MGRAGRTDGQVDHDEGAFKDSRDKDARCLGCCSSENLSVLPAASWKLANPTGSGPASGTLAGSFDLSRIPVLRHIS